VGCGSDVTIRELAEMVAAAVEYPGRIVFDTTKPDGTPRKLLDTSRATALGWKPSVSLQDGIAATYAWYRDVH
jgi:GDP-L-fucose synthase